MTKGVGSFINESRRPANRPPNDGVEYRGRRKDRSKPVLKANLILKRILKSKLGSAYQEFAALAFIRAPALPSVRWIAFRLRADGSETFPTKVETR